MSAQIDALIPELRGPARDLVNVAGQAGLQPRVTSTLRSRAQQKKLYDRFLAGASQYPAAPPGRSAHEYGFAFDMVVSPMEYLPQLGAIWIEAGGVWHSSDAIHFEYPGFTLDAPQTQPEYTGIGGAIRTVAEWFNSLPWYVQMLLPTETLSQDVSPITAQKMTAYLKAAGY